MAIENEERVASAAAETPENKATDTVAPETAEQPKITPEQIEASVKETVDKIFAPGWWSKWGLKASLGVAAAAAVVVGYMVGCAVTDKSND